MPNTGFVLKFLFPLKAYKLCAFKGELSIVPFHKVTKLIMGHLKLQSVAGVKLKGGKIAA